MYQINPSSINIKAITNINNMTNVTQEFNELLLNIALNSYIFPTGTQ